MAVETLLLVNHAHTDFGYTDHAESLFRQQRRIIDKAIDVCERDASRADYSRFRWTCEVTETTLRWLRASKPQQIDRFLALYRQGLIGVAAMPMHWTPLISPALAERSLDRLRALREDYGIAAKTAWQCDVNGLAWYWTDLLLDAGVDRLVMAFLGPLLIAHISAMIAPDYKDKTAGVFLVAFALLWFWVAKTINADIFVTPIPWKGIGLGLIQASLLIGSCIYSFRSIRELHG